eukprot:3813618-Amphidinium_carterae.1
MDQMEKSCKAKHGETFEMPGVESVKELHRRLEKIGAWSAPLQQSGNRFLKRKDKIPDVLELPLFDARPLLPQ